jgi:putative transposase
MVFMPRRPRFASGGFVYHVLNRAVGRGPIFEKEGDYAAFMKVLREAKEWQPMRLMSFCLMPNHRHLLLWAHEDGDISEFMRWLTVMHTQRWHARYQTAGTGPLYQGRFKSFPVQEDEHFLAVCRYVERNARRANLVPTAQDWKWCSLDQALGGASLIDPWPVDRPRNWSRQVNQPETEKELEALRSAVVRGCPYGDEEWQQQTAKMLGLEATLRPRGRPKKQGQQAK